MFKHMTVLKTTAKKWGNSLGILLPKKIGIRENEEIEVRIRQKKRIITAGDIFGLIKQKRSTKEELEELNKELASKWM